MVHMRPYDTVQAINQHLSRLLLKYNEDLGGVPLMYAQARTVESAARVHFERPHLHTTVQCKMLLFKPKSGTMIG